MNSKHDEILKLFLEEPHSRKRFNDFFHYCYRLTIGYLGYLKVKGYHLPLETISDRNPLSDLAYDVLGSLLRSKKGQPCIQIFEFFRMKGISDFINADPKELNDLFRSLLFRSIRQELSKIKKEENPQLDNLKKRFKDIFKTDKYEVFSQPNDNADYVCLAGRAAVNDQACSVVHYEGLLKIVEQAYFRSNTRSEWCYEIFKELEKDITVGNCVRKFELIIAAVAVNSKYVEVECPKPFHFPGADKGILIAEINKCKEQTLTWLKTNVLSRLVEKKKVSVTFANNFQKAADRYLTDLAQSPGIGPIPTYFREVMPKSEHRHYLKKYKHVFETTIDKAIQDFQRRLKKNPIISFHGDYYINEEEDVR